MGRRDDEIADEFNPYGASEVADLTNGVLVELKHLVDAEIEKRVAECKLLETALKKPRTRKKRNSQRPPAE